MVFRNEAHGLPGSRRRPVSGNRKGFLFHPRILGMIWMKKFFPFYFFPFPAFMKTAARKPCCSRIFNAAANRKCGKCTACGTDF
ncbi:hypothetical protein HMPREF1326_00326 [Akkermansia sp. KLE1605]|nr:hypothetical protein HMPREF1326_00326 [Akkermansia sp. KLE1605]